MAREFVSLTRRGQARRLRALALRALEQYDLQVTHLRLVTNDMNCVFRVETASGAKYVLWVGIGGEIAHTIGQIRSAMMWLAALRRDTDLAVPEPLPTRDGELVIEVEAPGVPEPRLVAIFSWLPGRLLADHISPAVMGQFGALVAKLHAHGAAWKLPEGFAPIRFDTPFPFAEPAVLFDEARAELVGRERQAFFRAAYDRAQAVIDRYQAEGVLMQPVHNDLHQWNLKVHHGRLAVFDFEDIALGYPVIDLGTLFFYYFEREDYPALLAAFRRGYEAVRAWPEREPGEIDAFIMARALVLANMLVIDPDIAEGFDVPTYLERTERRLRLLTERVGA
jgi:Ser/Thr protein kinase RdoA (MazF antagonist)